MKATPPWSTRGSSVSVKIFETQAEQRRSMWLGTRRLLLLNVTSPAKSLLGGLSNQAKLALSRSPHGGAVALFEDVVNAAVDKLMRDVGGPSVGPCLLRRLYQHVRAELYDTSREILAKVEQILAAWHEVNLKLGALRSDASTEDVRDQMGKLIFPGFITATEASRLPDISALHQGDRPASRKLPEEPWRDVEWMDKVHKVETTTLDVLDKLPPARRGDPDVREIRLDDRGAAGQLLRPDPRHPDPPSRRSASPRLWRSSSPEAYHVPIMDRVGAHSRVSARRRDRRRPRRADRVRLDQGDPQAPRPGRRHRLRARLAGQGRLGHRRHADDAVHGRGPGRRR
ncbi:hypothetical protein GCM10020219_086970 [Nonomuraea dietziae]